MSKRGGEMKSGMNDWMTYRRRRGENIYTWTDNSFQWREERENENANTPETSIVVCVCYNCEDQLLLLFLYLSAHFQQPTIWCPSMNFIVFSFIYLSSSSILSILEPSLELNCSTFALLLLDSLSHIFCINEVDGWIEELVFSLLIISLPPFTFCSLSLSLFQIVCLAKKMKGERERGSTNGSFFIPIYFSFYFILSSLFYISLLLLSLSPPFLLARLCLCYPFNVKKKHEAQTVRIEKGGIQSRIKMERERERCERRLLRCYQENQDLTLSLSVSG